MEKKNIVVVRFTSRETLPVISGIMTVAKISAGNNKNAQEAMRNTLSAFKSARRLMQKLEITIPCVDKINLKFL